MKLQYTIYIKHSKSTRAKYYLSSFFPACKYCKLTVEFITRIQSQEDQQIYFFHGINAHYTDLNFSSKCNQEFSNISKQVQRKTETNLIASKHVAFAFKDSIIRSFVKRSRNSENRICISVQSISIYKPWCVELD